jgi:hypothetical protein
MSGGDQDIGGSQHSTSKLAETHVDVATEAGSEMEGDGRAQIKIDRKVSTNTTAGGKEINSDISGAQSQTKVTDEMVAPDIPLRKLIPPKDCPRIRKRLGDMIQLETEDSDSSPSVGWSAVIARAKSHPHEAAEPFFYPVVETGEAAGDDKSEGTLKTDNSILAYKPLHALLKYNPPIEAVEAVLRANPWASLDVTFEGTALKIAAESRVSSAMVLRLLLVAEMAMRKRSVLRQQGGRRKDLDEASPDSSEHVGKELRQAHAPDTNPRCDDMFCGHNPILWIHEPRIPVTTAAMLLRWYPVGAIQRPCDEDGAPVDIMMADELGPGLEGCEAESPLIEMVDNFARDHYDDDIPEDPDADSEGDESYYGFDYDSDDEDLDIQATSVVAEAAAAAAEASQQPPQSRQHRKLMRKEKRWEKFLHVLYAADLALKSDNSTSPSTQGDPADAQSASGVTSVDIPAKDKPSTPFRPVHAWVRCMTTPRLGLQRCRPYGAWSVFRDMGRRIPSEFGARDVGDQDRTAFEILAERPASDCRLCREEVRDIMECLIDADHRSAFLPRKSDGRLIGHVALENGWPCKDLFSRKKSATCA